MADVNPHPRTHYGTEADRVAYAGPRAPGDKYVTQAGVFGWDGTQWRGGGGATTLVQTQYTELAADVSTAVAVYGVLLTQAIVMSAGTLIIHFTASASNSLNNVHDNIFAIFLDGVFQCSAGFTSSGAAHHENVALIKRITGIPNGPHTVTIQWKTSGGVLSCTPLSDENDFASMLIEEVNV